MKNQRKCNPSGTDDDDDNILYSSFSEALCDVFYSSKHHEESEEVQSLKVMDMKGQRLHFHSLGVWGRVVSPLFAISNDLYNVSLFIIAESEMGEDGQKSWNKFLTRRGL